MCQAGQVGVPPSVLQTNTAEVSQIGLWISKKWLLTVSIQESKHISRGHTSAEQPGSYQALPLLLSDDLHYLQLLHVGIQLVFQVVWNRMVRVTESTQGQDSELGNCAAALPVEILSTGPM